MSLHYHKKLAAQEEANILTFPFQCSKTLLISCLLIMSVVGIPIFVAYAAFAAQQRSLPHYPPLKSFMQLFLKTLFKLGPLIAFIIYSIYQQTVNPWITIGLVAYFYLLPTQLLSPKFLASVRPAFRTTYFLRALITFAFASTLFYLAMLLDLLPTVGSYVNYGLVVLSFYYAIIFGLTLLSEEVKENLFVRVNNR